MIWIITMGIIIMVIIFISLTEDVDCLIIIPLVIASIIFGASLMEDYHTKNRPSSLDVYRGKTTLEITSVNGVPKDSVVIFKSK